MAITYTVNLNCVSTMNPYGIDLFNNYIADSSAPYPANLWSDVFRINLSLDDLPADYDNTIVFVLDELRSKKHLASELWVRQLEMFYKHHISLNEIGSKLGYKQGATTNISNNIRKCIGPLRREFCLLLQYGIEEASDMKKQKAGPWSGLERPMCELQFSNATSLFLRKLNIITIQQLIDIDWIPLLNRDRIKVSGIIREVNEKLAESGILLQKSNIQALPTRKNK